MGTLSFTVIHLQEQSGTILFFSMLFIHYLAQKGIKSSVSLQGLCFKKDGDKVLGSKRLLAWEVFLHRAESVAVLETSRLPLQRSFHTFRRTI